MIGNVSKILIPAAIAFFIGIAITPFLTSFLYKNKMWKKKSGKIGLDGNATAIFNELHKEKEVGTPRMGGIVIWLSTTITILGTWLLATFVPNDITLKLNFLTRDQTWIPLVMFICGAVVGLFDDYLEIRGIGNRKAGGLSLRWRLLVVALVSFLSASWFFFKLGVVGLGTPWGVIYLGPFIIPFFVAFSLFLYSGGVIDGIDGLSGGIFSIIFSAYGLIAFYQNQVNLATFCFAVVGAILAFLWFNIPPARFYMSETGSMALTMALAAVIFMTDTLGDGYGVFVAPIIALPLVLTTLSVIIQMLSKKFRGKKIFLVAPLHHHFEAIGWPSYKVTMRYWIISIITAIIGVLFALTGRSL